MNVSFIATIVSVVLYLLSYACILFAESRYWRGTDLGEFVQAVGRIAAFLSLAACATAVLAAVFTFYSH